MKEKSHIAITGYYGTGSSAVIDLLKEYEGVSISAPVETEYEHVALYYPGGLMDLYLVLSSEFCSVYNSDMIINRFIQASKNLNDYDYGWIGSYKKHYGNKFELITNEFVNQISRKTGRQSAGHMYKVRFSLIKAILQIGARILIKRPITKLGRLYVTDKYPGYYAMPNINHLNRASKQYILDYLNMCSKGSKINVFDHLIWPQQCDLIDVIFPEKFKAIVVRRDPRDVYLLNKYYWHKPPVSVSKPYYSTQVEIFCKEWEESVKTEFKSQKILSIYFEDLIYRYEETKSQVESFLGLSKEKHTFPLTKYKPEMSIENTQVFLINEEWKKEIKTIEERLGDYLYHFPYERVPDKSKWFDTEAQLNNIKSKKK